MPVPAQPFPLPFWPVELVTSGEFRCVVKLVFRDVGPIAMELRVVLQLAPGDRMRVGPNGKKRV
jgi:hypothetical protein